MHFNENDKVCRILQTDIELLPVLNRFNIRTGVHDKTIGEICDEQGLNMNFVLAVLNTYYDPAFFPKETLMNVSPIEIINYLKSTHRYYYQIKLPQIEILLEQFLDSCKTNREQVSLIKLFYDKYKSELVAHVEDEEKNVFPQILDFVNNNKWDLSFSAAVFQREHSNVDDKLNDLKSLIIKYLDSDYDDFLCYQFLKSIFEFEQDIRDHARIEDKILIPQILELENKRRGGHAH